MAGHGMNLALTLGVEEEFFLIDPETRDLLADPDERIFEYCEQNRGRHRFVRELLRSQLESNTCVCNSIAEVREALVETRRRVIEAAERCGANVMASSSPTRLRHGGSRRTRIAIATRGSRCSFRTPSAALSSAACMSTWASGPTTSEFAS